MKLLIITLLLLLSFNLASSQSNPDYWKLINTSNSTIFTDNFTKIHFESDSNTFFFGSFKGLEVWDSTGTNFYHYGYPNVPNKSIVDIYPENGGMWFLGIENGLIFNSKTEHIEYNYLNSPLPQNGLNELEIGPDGTKWVASKNGLHRLRDGEWSTFSDYSVRPKYYYISSVEIVDTHEVYFTFAHGIGHLKNDSISYYYLLDTTEQYQNIGDLFLDTALNCLWYTEGSFMGFFKLDLKSFEKTQFFHETNDQFTFGSSTPATYIYGPFGNLWLGTHDGVVIFDPIEEKVILHFNDYDTPLPQHQIYDIWFDENKKDVWFTTWGGGLAKWEYGKDPEFMAVMGVSEINESLNRPEITFANGHLTISNLNETATIILYDLMGREIQRIVLNSISNSHKLPISSDLQNQVIVVQIQSDDFVLSEMIWVD
ncbi:MAG: hypothetical protein ACI9WO_001439 [Sphingobacteriales bacterium]|jgi:hypothetical protein